MFDSNSFFRALKLSGVEIGRERERERGGGGRGRERGREGEDRSFWKHSNLQLLATKISTRLTDKVIIVLLVRTTYSSITIQYAN